MKVNQSGCASYTLNYILKVYVVITTKGIPLKKKKQTKQTNYTVLHKQNKTNQANKLHCTTQTNKTNQANKLHCTTQTNKTNQANKLHCTTQTKQNKPRCHFQLSNIRITKRF